MFSLGPRCARRVCLPSPRCISSSAPTFTSPPRGPRLPRRDDDDDAEPMEGEEELRTFNAFLNKFEKFKTAEPFNYLPSPETSRWQHPFPMNPSFRPPIPISDATRSRMYADYMLDPITNSVRNLAQRHHTSMKRVEAILRLKGLEAAYVKVNKPLQTGFLWGMEMLLGVTTPKTDSLESPAENSRSYQTDRNEDGKLSNVQAADLLEEEENRDAARQRFQRQYWESIPDDGKEPLLPASLEKAKKVAERSAQAAHDNKSNAILMPRFKDTATIKSPRQKVQTIVAEGRLPIHFIDVGGKFLDVDERLRRMSGAGRRHSIRSKRSEVKVLKGFLKGRTPVERARRASVKRSTS
ncbi:eukaryotic mitochondrial regulator protein-domain-containing protein [Mycena polygramma]|nr:eukaryotic mitochondrial regulator protein-domain-containing protein [Mycena polygramma]